VVLVLERLLLLVPKTDDEPEKGVLDGSPKEEFILNKDTLVGMGAFAEGLLQILCLKRKTKYYLSVHKVIVQGKTVAIKVFTDADNFKAELEVMSQLDHPNLVSLANSLYMLTSDP